MAIAEGNNPRESLKLGHDIAEQPGIYRISVLFLDQVIVVEVFRPHERLPSIFYSSGARMNEWALFMELDERHERKTFEKALICY